ncbi:MAG: LPS-assembly protein LptD, partial [Ahrensia sp.]
DGIKLVARQVTYDQSTGRVIAAGDVEIIERDGTRILATEIDVTDDFSDGFVNALKVETVDDTTFVAESAERRDNNITTFNNGAYTACEPCRENPDKPLLWNIKAKKIIWNGQEKTVRFENATFEFFGVPLARLPVFTTADPTVKRKTGFLIPTIGFSSELGASVSVPYFIVVAPDKDIRLTTTGYTRQGFLAEAEFRHQLVNGSYSLKAAGINQLEPDAFDRGTTDANEDWRGMAGSKGKFDINPRWSFGWDVMVQSDNNFSSTYDIEGFNEGTRRNNIYLTGLGTRSYFNAEVIKYDIQEASTAIDSDEREALVLPTVDYNYVVDQPVAGGELSFDVNMRGLSREKSSQLDRSGLATRGLAGESFSSTIEAEWKRNIVTNGGLMLTPILHAQGNGQWLDLETETAYSASGALLTDDSSTFRGMVTAGMEARWPILFSTTSSTHVLEPIAQVFVRPDERNSGSLPNEDAQSFVFDTTTLFQRDKFSGYDRMEGGSRANVGLRYTGAFDNGWGLNAAFGQSYHLGGLNSFAAADMVNAGRASGLETDRSDYVGSFGVTSDLGLSALASGRFDEQDFRLRRADMKLGYRNDIFSTSLNYAYIDAQPEYGFTGDRQEISSAASLKFAEDWTVFGGLTYNLETSKVERDFVGLTYHCECFLLSLTYSEDRTKQDVVDKAFMMRISLRTLGDFNIGSNAFDE